MIHVGKMLHVYFSIKDEMLGEMLCYNEPLSYGDDKDIKALLSKDDLIVHKAIIPEKLLRSGEELIKLNKEPQQPEKE